MAAGLPVFGALHVPRPIRVWYMQMERPDIESLERIQIMQNVIEVAHDNIIIDTELQKLYFLNPEHLAQIIERGKQLKPDIAIIDPLYGLAPGLSKDDVASQLVKTLTILKAELGVTLWLNHHHTKESYASDGSRINKDDAFYGSQWIKAHVTGSYSVERTDSGVCFTCKKDSHSNLLQTIDLAFDHETNISSMTRNSLSYPDRFKLFINARFRSPNKTFFFEEARQNVGCAVRTMRGIIAHPLFAPCLTVHKSNGVKVLYEVLREL